MTEEEQKELERLKKIEKKWIKIQEIKWVRKYVKEDYPSLVCSYCGLTASGGRSKESLNSNEGECDVCKRQTYVTSPSNFYYPNFEFSKKRS